MRELIGAVEVGALLSIHLDVDEPLVHHVRGRLVLEGLVRHHMAPVARGIADGKKDRTALGAGDCEGSLTPRVPIDRIVGVLG